MTRLTDITNLHYHPLCQNIRSIEELSKESRNHNSFNSWKQIEQKVMQETQAPSFSAWILYEHHFNQKSVSDLGKLVGIGHEKMRWMVKKMNIPTMTTKEFYNQPEIKKKLSKSRKGRKKSAEHARHIGDAHLALNGHTQDVIESIVRDYIETSTPVRELATRYHISSSGIKYHIENAVASGRITYEQRIEAARKRQWKRGEQHPNYGRRTPDEVRKKIADSNRGRKASKEARENRIDAGFKGHPMTDGQRRKFREYHQSAKGIEEDRNRGIELAKKQKYDKYLFQGNYFDSQTEASIAALLVKYIPGFGLQDGETIQVIKDAGVIFDFVLPKAIVEWHPIVIIHQENDLERKAMMQDLKSQIRTRADRRVYKQWEREYKEDLAIEYWMKRQEASDKSGYFKGKEVVLARNLKEFYEQVLLRYGENVPEFFGFMKEFRGFMAQVKPVKNSQEAAE